MTPAGRGSTCWPITHGPRFAHLGTTFAMREKPQWSIRFASAGERHQAGKEHDHGTAHGHRRRDDRHGQGHRSAVYRLITAAQPELIKIGCPQRASLASIRHVAALKVKTRRPGESPTSEHLEEVGDVVAA
jgi:hypothetical protein